MIEPWDRVELAFAIDPQAESFGDIIETVVVLPEFIGRKDQISPVSISFHIRYLSPKLVLKFEGSTQILSLAPGQLTVVSLKPSKLGEYQLAFGLE